MRQAPAPHRIAAAPAPKPALPESRPLLASAWMLGAIVSFSAMAIAGRAVSFDHDTFEILLYRSLVAIVIVLVVGGTFGTLRQITTRRMGLHLIRNLSHFAGQNAWFYALPLIPLAQLISVEFTSPIWTALLAALVLGERLTLSRVAAAAMGFIGVLVVARPDFNAIDAGILAAACAALGFAGSAVATRMLTRTETVTCILFWLSIMQALFGLICAGIDGDIALPSAAGLPWLMLIGLSGLFAHFCLTTALSLAPAGIVMTMDFMRLPVLAVIGMAFYGEALEWAVALGAALILTANAINLRRG